MADIRAYLDQKQKKNKENTIMDKALNMSEPAPNQAVSRREIEEKAKKCIKELQAQKGRDRWQHENQLEESTFSRKSSFSKEIQDLVLPQKFKMPQVTPYARKTDLTLYTDLFKDCRRYRCVACFL